MKKYLPFLNLILIFSTFLSPKIANAQLGFCSGNSGAPIFTENFGTGIGSSTLPGAGTTGYTYANGFPGDGFYTVRNGSFGNGFDWHQTEDHTVGDTEGKFLIVNASFSSDEFYRTTVSGLCETTTYEFSAWLLNLVIANSFCSTTPGGTIPINVSFEIWDTTDTNLLAIGNTGNITEWITPIWQQFGLIFQTQPGQTSVILKMINNGVGGCGNDLAIDDIDFKTCGDFIFISDTANVDTLSLCSSQTPYATTLTVTPDGSVFNTYFYQWETSPDGITWTDIAGETTPNITLANITSSGFYRAKVAESAVNLGNTSCNVASEIYEVIVNQLPAAPSIECWETATINDTTCSWEVTGTQPTQPTGLECWETTTFNNTTCVWYVTGNQPAQPTLECWETTTFNNTICAWEITGTQPLQPILECWETTTFNNTICVWDITGTQPSQPTLECWETVTFNNATCIWDVTGTQPTQPTGLACWETTIFNNTTCIWDVTGTQPTQPTGLECWEIEIFNDVTCLWEVSGDQPINTTEETLDICENEALDLQAVSTIINPTYLWSTTETTEFITIDQSGVYTVEITDGCSTTTSTFNVEQIDNPIISTVQSLGNSIVITTSNSGNFEYSLDGSSFQSSNIFEDIDSEQYTIYVKNQDCDTLVTSPFIHFYISQFFTPNGDTENETFDITGLEFYQSSEVQIFDRYGKLLKSARNVSLSWDGTYNGNLLPTNDYWYVVIIEGQRRVGHFTLKR